MLMGMMQEREKIDNVEAREQNHWRDILEKIKAGAAHLW